MVKGTVAERGGEISNIENKEDPQRNFLGEREAY
jgi:hypothetical protein